jgi:predicted nucleic acid-binding protein
VTVPPVVSNASPVIALARIGYLGLLEQIFGSVVVPPAVVREVAPTLPVLPGWVVEWQLTQPLGPRLLRATLAPGRVRR